MNGNKQKALVWYLQMLVLLTCLLLVSEWTDHSSCPRPLSVCLLVQFKRWRTYFSTSGVEFAVVTEEPRGHTLVYGFLKQPFTVLSPSIRLSQSTSALAQKASLEQPLPWRMWQYLTHLEKGGVWRLPRSFGLGTSFSQSPVLRLLCSTGKKSRNDGCVAHAVGSKFYF